ncbi:HAD family hydrolase [Nakamurella antarctica]|uniref:HAD family hydrolase n=1 Tax=Nakamurella antarctica TaxID=1902245 RepID=A0A3G8ZTZ1_9ACTN|nr:haloacid dehalogenase-like hydrolase [Nakamurella antarctica]AZI57261.1 HAD family hydrolase [Nakamurella antarctica]
MSFTIGFDLDMTLIDPRRGMIALFDVIAAESGIPLDGKAFAARLGPPLEQEFARYDLPSATVTALVERFRELYIDIVIPQTIALPGALAAVQAVHDRGGRVIVVTGKYGPNAIAHLDALGMKYGAVIGKLWGEGKAAALREHQAEVYVGDHIGDMAGARQADAMAVAVATGPISAENLAAAGADVVLRDLTQFPRWLDSYLLATVH